jgi:hypothetical protein
MTSHTWSSARVLLDTKLLTLSGIVLAKVKFPGRPWTPPASGPWWKVDFIPAAVDVGAGLGGYTSERGTYQVTVFDKPGETQPGAIHTAADALVALFDRAALVGTGVTVQCAVPLPGPLLEEPVWIGIPVQIPFQAL